MSEPCLRTHPFAVDERGAVTVDWVVLTAALVGLGIAVMGVVSQGARAASQNVSTTVGSIDTRWSFVEEAAQRLLDTGFAEGAAGWIGGTVATLEGFGEVLQIEGGATASFAADIPEGAETATVSFSLIGGDDLDGEPATISINGRVVSVYRDDHGRISISGDDVDGISVSVSQRYENERMGGGDHGSDSRADYTITVDDPGATLLVGVSSGADQGLGNEFYAIDDVTIDSQ